MDVRVLGPLEVAHGSGTVALQGLRQRAVLAVLLIQAGQVVSSDQLADLVWDGSPPDQAPASLQAYVSKLRRILEPGRDGRARPWEVLVTRSPGYALEIDPRAIDAVRFERACDQATIRLRDGEAEAALAGLDEALGWWRGEPYADFAFAGFARNEIGRLTELRWRAVEDRSDALLRLGRHREVVAQLDALVGEAPLRERLRGQLMVALYRSGRQADALAVCAEGRSVLVEELGLDPGPELRRLEQAILDHDPDLDWSPADPPASGPVAVAVPAGDPAAPPPPSLGDGRPPMVGRTAERERVAAVLDRATAGQGSLILVCGEAGIGKTRLAEEAAAVAGATGVDVVWGRCPELEGVPPFWPWVQVLRSVLGSPADDVDPLVAALVPELRTDAGPPPMLAADSDAARFRLYDAVTRVLTGASGSRPLLVVLEDLHWADAASLRLLRFLAPDLTRHRLTVLATLRDHEGPSDLDELRAEAARLAAVERVDLHRLDRDAVAELTSRLARTEISLKTVADLAERSGGNPFFLGELIRLGAAGRGAVPVGVRDVIQRRVGQLDEPTRQVLSLASCFPDDTALDTVAAVLGLPVLDVLDRMDRALAARLVIEVPDRTGWFRFSHPLVREALYEQLSALRRAHLHRAIAVHLQDALPAGGFVDDESVAQLAHHFQAAAPAGTVPEAVRWSLEAGHRDLHRWAGDEARACFETALDLARTHGGADEAELVDLLIGAGRARRFVGDGHGRVLLEEAMAEARSIDEPARAVRAALATGLDAWGLGGSFDTVDERLRAALDWALPRLDPGDAGQRRLHVLGTTRLALELVFDADQTIAPTLSAAALAEARALGEPEPLAAALTARWLAVWGPSSVTERRGLVAELDALGDARTVDPARVLLLRSVDALEQADRAGVDAVLADADALVADGRHPALEFVITWRRSLRAIIDGRFEEAEGLVADAHARAAQVSARDAFDAYGGQMALLYWQWGRLVELEPLIAAAIAEHPYLGSTFGVVHALALAQGGRADEARAVIAGLDFADRSAAPAALVRSGTVSALVATAAELGDAGLARAGLRFLGDDDASSPALVDHHGTFYLGARAGFRGLAHLVTGEWDAAVHALERGIAVNERIGAVVHVLRNQLDLADALTRRGAAGDRPRAAELASVAGENACRLGLDADRARAELLAKMD